MDYQPELNFQKKTLYVPVNKQSAWAYKKGATLPKDASKKYQGYWSFPSFTLDGKNPVEIWIFWDSDARGIDERVLHNNPDQGAWGWAKPDIDTRNAKPGDMIFYPPDSKLPKSFNVQGLWVKPMYKRDMGNLKAGETGFIKASDEIKKGSKLSIGGTWKVLGHNDAVGKGRRKKGSGEEVGRGQFKIYVRTTKGKKFSLIVIPGNKIAQVKDKVNAKKKIPVAEQRMVFDGVPLLDERTVVGSGIRNGDTIDLVAMEIFVRTPKGKKFKYEVEPEDPVEGIKKMAESDVGIPAEDQRLFFRKLQMNDGNPISKYGVRHKSVLDLGSMVIYVEPVKDPTFELDVESSDTIRSIKLKIMNRLKIPVDDQNLFFKETELIKPEATLHDHNIRHKDTIVMRDMLTEPEPEPVEEMKIYVIKDWDQKKFALTVLPSHKIMDVKKMIKKKKKIPVKSQILTFKGKGLVDKKTLEDSNIQNKSVLHLEDESTPPKVTIKPTEGRSFDLDIEPDDKPKDVKKKIGKKIGKPPRDFYLVNEETGKPVDNKGKILPGETYTIEMVDSEPEITIKPSKGRSFNLIIDPDDTVDDIKKKAAKKSGYPFDVLKFVDDEGEEPDGISKPRPGRVYHFDPPQVEVELPNKKKIKLDLLPKDKIGDLKDRIEDETGIPKSRQRIFHFDGEDDLGDKKSVFKAKLGDGMPIRLEEEPEPEITIKPSKGRSFNLIIDPDDTVDDIKKKAAKKSGYPFDVLKFVDDEGEEPDGITKPRPGRVYHFDPPQVEIELPNKKKIKLDLLPKDKIEDLKDRIEDETGIPKSRQRIFHFDEEDDLGDKKSVFKAGINDGTLLQMKDSPGEELMIKLPRGRSFHLYIDPEESPPSVKKKIANMLQMPIKDLKLLDEDEDSIDDDKLSSQHVLVVDPPKVEVTLPNKKKFELGLLPTTTMQEVKDIIEEETGTPNSRQRVFFLDAEGNEIADDVALGKTKLKNGNCLEMKESDDAEITFKSRDGRTFVLMIDKEDTVKDVKKKLKKKCKLSVGGFMLGDIELDDMDDDDTFLDDEKGIRHGAVLAAEPAGRAIDAPTVGKKVKAGDPLDIRPFDEPEDDAEITFKSRDGRTFVLMIDKEDTAKDVKKKLRKKYELPVGGFMLGDIELDDIDDDDTFLDDEKGIRHGAVLAAEPAEVEIEVPGTGKKVKMVLLPTTTIAEVKKVIEEQVPEYKEKKQRMFFFDNAGELDDSTPLVKLELEKGMQLELRSLQIVVQHWNGDKEIIDADTTEYVDDLKEKISKALNVPIPEQRLTFKGEPLLEDVKVGDLGLQNDSVLILEPMIVYVEDPTGKKHELVVEVGDTMRSIKDTIFEYSGTAVNVQCIVSGPTEFPNESTLAECGIEHEDELQVELYKVNVMDWTGDVFAVAELKPSDTIADLKSRIKKQKKIPKKDQLLALNGAALNDNETLFEAGVKHKSIVVLEDPEDVDLDLPEREMLSLNLLKKKKFHMDDDEIWPVVPDWSKRIFFFDNDVDLDEQVELTIMHWTGKTFTLQNVELRWTVQKLKKKIYKVENIPTKKQFITFEGEHLDSEKTLRQQMVKNKSILVLEGKRQTNLEIPDSDKLSLGIIPTMMAGEIQVRIEHWNGEVFTVSAQATDYIDDLKDTIHAMKGIPQDEQRLTHDKKSVRDEDTLKEQSIIDGTLLVLLPMRIVVETPSGKQVDLVVESTFTIKKLKKMIYKTTRTDVDVQCITFGGDILDEDKTLSECEVEHEDVVTMEIFKVSIMHWSGDVFSLDRIKPNATTASVKEEILNLKHIPVKQQKLSFKSKELEENATLHDEGIHHKAVLVLEQAVDREKRSAPTRKYSFMKDFMPKPEESDSLDFKVELSNGQSFSIKVEPTEYADDIRDKIFEKTKIKIDNQRLLYNGAHLLDDIKLEDQDLPNGSTLQVEQMRLLVEAPGGRQLVLGVEADDTIKMVKRKIFKEEKVKVGVQCIIVGGETLENDRTLDDYNLGHEDTVTLEIFSIKILHWSGEQFILDTLRPEDTIRTLKKEIQRTQQIPELDQVLRFRESILEDSKNLLEQEVGHKCLIILEKKEEKKEQTKKKKIVLSTALKLDEDQSDSDSSDDSDSLPPMSRYTSSDEDDDASETSSDDEIPSAPTKARGSSGWWQMGNGKAATQTNDPSDKEKEDPKKSKKIVFRNKSSETSTTSKKASSKKGEGKTKKKEKSNGISKASKSEKKKKKKTEEEKEKKVKKTKKSSKK